jgi:predicted DCC family thiol-disulfide oxidoreductase YuxK
MAPDNHQLSNSPTHQFPSVILFDGVCTACNAFVQFVVKRDRARRFAFAPLQSAAARRLIGGRMAIADVPSTLLLVEGDRLFSRSTASLRIARALRFPWNLAYGLVVVPRPIRDWVYDVIARHRYEWFGKRDACMVPTPDLRSRFLSD